MRQSQIALFVLGTTAMIGSALGIGRDFGETLWKTGIAVLLIDLVCLQLWPSTRRP